VQQKPHHDASGLPETRDRSLGARDKTRIAVGNRTSISLVQDFQISQPGVGRVRAAPVLITKRLRKAVLDRLNTPTTAQVRFRGLSTKQLLMPDAHQVAVDGDCDVALDMNIAQSERFFCPKKRLKILIRSISVLKDNKSGFVIIDRF
jgi:hypothetical protein